MIRRLPKFQHIHQTRQTAPPLSQEIPLQNLLRTCPILDLHRQTLAQKDLQLLTQLIRILQCRRAVGRNQEKRFEGFFVEVRGFGFDHLNGHDAEGPHVDFGAVFFLLDDFGGHPVGSADHGGAFGFLVGQFGAETEVGYGRFSVGGGGNSRMELTDFNIATSAEEDVVAFDVTVDDILAVEVG